MKKYLIIIFAFLALSGYGQQDLKARYLNVTRMLYSGTDSLISPADSAHQFNYMKMKDPVLSLDGVNKRSMERFVGDTAKLLHWSDTLPTSGARIATGDDIKNMIDGSGTASFIPKFSDANTLTNSVFKDDGASVTINQNGVAVATSVTSGAVGNTLYLKEGKMGIGTNNPLTTEGGLDISSGGMALVIGADNVATTRTDNTTKYGRIFIPHYKNAEKPISVFIANSELTENLLQIGGGTSLGYATTRISFYTALNNTTTTGTERARLTNSGNFIIGATSTTSKFDVQALGSTNPIATFSNDKNATKDSTVVISKLGGITTSYNLGVRTTLADNPLAVNCGTTGGIELDYNDADGSAVNKVVYGVTSSGDATVTPSGGDVELTTSNLKLQSTTNASQFGIIYKGTAPFIHNFNYGNNGTVTTIGRNTFIGISAGNLTMGATATNDYQSSGNTGGGFNSLSNLTLGYRTTALGYYSGTFTTTGSNLLNPIESVFIGGNTRSKSDGSQNEIVVGFSAYGNGSNTVTIGNSSITDNYFNGNLISGKIKTTQITAALTDNTPTDAEIDAATSLTPSTAGAGWQCTIKDNNGSGLLYKVESDGTDWYYIALTKAL